MGFKYLLGVAFVLASTCNLFRKLSNCVDAASPLETLSGLNGQERHQENQTKCQAGITLARTVLDPKYKEHLNNYDGAGENVEFLLNSRSVQSLLKGNATKHEIIQKALVRAGIQEAAIINGKELIKKVHIILKERIKENKLNPFLKSLKYALQDIDRENTKEDEIKKERFCECKSDLDCVNSHDMEICSKCNLETGSCLTANYNKNGNCPLENRAVNGENISRASNMVPNSDRVMSLKYPKTSDYPYPPIQPKLPHTSVILPGTQKGPLFVQNGGNMQNYFGQLRKFPFKYFTNISLDVCKDKGTCDEVTPRMCSEFPFIKKDCPLSCGICKCKDDSDCSDVTTDICDSWPDVRQKCMRTCKICEDRDKRCIPYSKKACIDSGKIFGFKAGGAGYDFEGNYKIKGCHAYTRRPYFGMMYYGTGGTTAQMQESLTDPEYRPPGYDCSKTGCDSGHSGQYIDDNTCNSNCCDDYSCSGDGDSSAYTCVEDNACFTGSSVVVLENGRKKKMSDLQVGDSVLTVDENNDLLFSPIILNLHRSPTKGGKFFVQKMWQPTRTAVGGTVLLRSIRLWSPGGCSW